MIVTIYCTLRTKLIFLIVTITLLCIMWTKFVLLDFSLHSGNAVIPIMLDFSFETVDIDFKYEKKP